MEGLDQRTVLVTGAAGGLGCALCSALVSGGANVIATDKSAEKGHDLQQSIPSGPGSLRYCVIDQSDPSRIAECVETLKVPQHPIDSLVNNAAIYPTGSAEDMTLQQVRQVLDVNVLAATAFMRALAPGMRRAGFGRVINVSSITCDLGFKDLSAYVASKAALVGLARVWAREYGPHGVTVNAISPGAFRTDAESIHADPEGYNRFVLEQQSIKRRGTPDDFVNLALFLLHRGSGFLTGQNIRVDGGWVMQ